MSTRGAMGIRINGIDKITFNHYDSYPSGLGRSIVNDVNDLLKSEGLDNLKRLASEIELINKDSLTKAQRDHFREMMGDFKKTIKSKQIIDDFAFILDSLFCEWAYIVNFDDNLFEVYVGYQKTKHSLGRFSDQVNLYDYNGSQYYPCALIAAFNLLDIPSFWETQLPA